MSSGTDDSNSEGASLHVEGVDGSPQADEAVGFKSPPKRHRFPKGKSGNPRGRPRKDRSRSRTVRRVLLEKRKVDLNGTGRPLQWTNLELVVVQLRQVALEGNTRAFKLYKELEARHGEQDTESKGGVVVIPTVDSRETWIKLFGAKD